MRLFRRGSLSKAQLAAALEIERMISSYHCFLPSYAVSAGETGSPGRERGGRAENRMCARLDGLRILQAWWRALAEHGLDASILTDILIHGCSFVQSDRKRHIRNGQSQSQFKAALSLFAETRTRQNGHRQNFPT